MNEQGQKLVAGATTLLVAEPAMHLLGTGGPGAIVGLAASVIAYLTVEEIQKVRYANGREDKPAPVREKRTAEPGKPSLAYRLVNGKSVREDGRVDTEGLPRITARAPGLEDDDLGFAADDLASLEDVIQKSDMSLPGPCAFSSALRTFKPTREKIFLGYLPGGQMVFVTLEDLCHVALAGLTGNGKSTLIRLLVSQLEYVGAKVLILNPHYTSYDIKKHEDWTPIERHLYRSPVTDFPTIASVMRWVATVLLRDRLDKYHKSIPWGEPVFVVIDELPAIVNAVPEFPEYISAVLREGRKVDIFLVVASQDFQQKTVGPDEAGAVRKNYKTKMYVGGDVTTAKVLLDMPPAQIPEDQLGGGIIMMRNQAVKKASLARVPYVDNEALYTLLGPSTYVADQHREEEDDLVAYAMGASDAGEPETEPLPTTPRYTPRSAYDVYQESKRARRPAAYVAREQGALPTRQASPMDVPQRAQDDVEISAKDAFVVWSAGNANVRDLAKAMGITTYQSTKLYGAMVDEGLIERKAKVTVRKD